MILEKQQRSLYLLSGDKTRDKTLYPKADPFCQSQQKETSSYCSKGFSVKGTQSEVTLLLTSVYLEKDYTLSRVSLDAISSRLLESLKGLL